MEHLDFKLSIYLKINFGFNRIFESINQKFRPKRNLIGHIVDKIIIASRVTNKLSICKTNSNNQSSKSLFLILQQDI